TLYYLLVTSLEGAAVRGRIPPWVAMWTPNAAFGAIGVVFLVLVARDVRCRGHRWLWRILDAPRTWWPRPGGNGREAHTGSARGFTVIIHRYLRRSQVTFSLIGVVVAAVVVVVVDLAQTL